MPDGLVRITVAREGEAGRRWIGSLPERVEALCARWSVMPDGPPMHGGMSLVVPVRRGEEACVLKVGWVDETTEQEALVLRAWDGCGAVRLLEAEPALGVLLLERLEFRRSLEGVALAEALPIAGRLLRRLALPAPEGLRSLKCAAAEIYGSLSERWERCGRPMPRAVVERAGGLVAALGPSSGDLLVNYDLHYADVLAAEREPWLAVDPKAIAGDLEYGIAQLLWRRLEEIEARGGLDHHFGILIESAGLDPELARAWTLVRCVDYCLWGLSVGLTEDPARCRRLVDWLSSGG